jgi:hypothetical protein
MLAGLFGLGFFNVQVVDCRYCRVKPLCGRVVVGRSGYFEQHYKDHVIV